MVSYLLRLSLIVLAMSFLQSSLAERGGPQQLFSADSAAGQNVCDVLRKAFPDRTFAIGDEPYDRSQEAYWTVQQSELTPACRFRPGTAEDVRRALDILVSSNTSFAVVSGGHSSYIGGSNIDRGVTIELADLSEITLTENNEAVFLGPGSKWSDVYASLEPYDLAVAGGRVSHVGVGGYVLGGGFSWLANREGWSCDSVLEFEVVTPDRQILQVSKSKHAELFWALKGSLGSIGIVTRIKMRTIRNTGIYGGSIAYADAQAPAVFSALVDEASKADQNLDTQGFISFAYVESMKDFVCATYLVNTRDDEAAAPIRNFLGIPHVHSTLRHTTLKGSADEIAESNPMGFRRSKFALTVKADVEVLLALHELSHQIIGSIRFDPKGLCAVTYQPMPRSMLQAQRENGGNIFSETLRPELAPLMLVSVDLWWEDASRDEEFEGMMTDYVTKMYELKGTDGAWHPWVYPNYAAAWQAPFDRRRLGDQTVGRLQRVLEQYDADGVWRRLRPGIWQI